MMSLFCLLLAFGENDVTNGGPIWEEISQMEYLINQRISKSNNSYAIANGNPARGYYITGQGVFIVVPLRYRGRPQGAPSRGSDRSQSLSDAQNKPAKATLPSKEDLQKRLAQWQTQLEKEEVLKEADFEQIITLVKESIPDIFTQLKTLSDQERLVIIVEEAPPAWLYASYSLKKKPTRKIVTLSVENDAYQLVKSSKTKLEEGWGNLIKRNNACRQLAGR